MSDRQTVLSQDRVYRYCLWREWPWQHDLFAGEPLKDPSSYVMFIGLNPSTADEIEDDPTIRKCIGFAKRWGYRWLCMTNLFALRATDPSLMLKHPEPIGEWNNEVLKCYGDEADLIVAAWGNHGDHLRRDEQVRALFRTQDLKCLRKTSSGQPEHPLYVPYEAFDGRGIRQPFILS